MTPRSYSRAILTAAKRKSRRENEDYDEHDQAGGHVHQAGSFPVGVDMDPTTSRRSSSTSSTRTCSPGTSGSPSALRARQSSPFTCTIPSPTNDGLVADHPVHADRDRSSRRTEHPRHRETEEKREPGGDADRDRHRDLVRVTGRVEEDQRAEDEHDRSGDRERTVRRHEGLGDEEGRGEEHQQQPRERDREHLEAVEAEDQRDRADGAGEDEAGVPELDDDPDQPDREHQRDEVRVDEEVAGALPEAHLDVLDLRAGGLEDEALRHRLHAVDLVEQRGKRRRDHLDEADALRLARAVVRRLRDHVPAPPRRSGRARGRAHRRTPQRR